MVPFKAPAKDIIATAPTVRSGRFSGKSWFDLIVPQLPYKQFLLFGDSITQGAFDQTKGFALGAQLAHGMLLKSSHA